MTPWLALCAHYGLASDRPRHMCKCPVHNDSTASLSVKPTSTGGVLLHCFAGCKAADIRTALALPPNPSAFTREHAPPKVPDRIVSEYPYYSAEGFLLATKRRWGPKKRFDWLSWDDREQRMRAGLVGGTGTLPLYRADVVARTAGAGGVVCLVEGEKDADNLAALGYVATTFPEGANPPATAYDRLIALAGATVYLFPDNDDVGRAHMAKAADVLLSHGIACYRVDLPNLPPKGDVSDWLAQPGHDAQALAYALTHAVECTDPAPVAVDAAFGDDFEERAGVREFAGGLSRADAERLAARDIARVVARLPVSERLALAVRDPVQAALLRELGAQMAG